MTDSSEIDWMNEQIVMTNQRGFTIYVTKVKTLRVTDKIVYVTFKSQWDGLVEVRLSKDQVASNWGHHHSGHSVSFKLLRNESPRVKEGLEGKEEMIWT